MPDRKGRMNRSRWVAAGTSVTALVALTAGVAAANPAPDGTQHRTATTGSGLLPRDVTPETPAVPTPDTEDTWGRLPSDPNPSFDTQPPAADPNAGSYDPAPQYDPGYQYAPPQGNTSSGGS